jgi:hypothetical protein
MTNFTYMCITNELQFRCRENLVFLPMTDHLLSTEVKGSFIEREYVNKNELRSKQYTIGEVYTTLCGGIRVLGIAIHIYATNLCTPI